MSQLDIPDNIFNWLVDFDEAQDRQKVYSFLRRSARVGYYLSDLAGFDDLRIQADENLFNEVLHNPDHVLHRLLPPVAHTSHTTLDHAHTTGHCPNDNDYHT